VTNEVLFREDSLFEDENVYPMEAPAMLIESVCYTSQGERKASNKCPRYTVTSVEFNNPLKGKT